MTEEQSKKEEHKNKHKEIYKEIDAIKDVFFGNKFDKGMVTKVNEMHKVFTGTGFTKKIIIGFIAFIGSIGALILMLIQIVKEFKK